MRTRSRTLAVAAALAALVLAACGGADDTSPDDGEEIEDGTEQDGADDPADEDAASSDADEDDATDDATDEDEAEDDGSEEAGGSQSSADLLAGVEFAAEPVKVEYSIEGDQQGLPASLTIAQDGTRIATYTTVEESGQTIETAAFIDGGEGVAFCINQSGGWSCFEQSDMQGEMGGMPDDLIEDTSIPEGEVADYLADAYRDEIAGREAICGTNMGFSQGDGGEVCVDANTGIVLRLDLGAATGESLIMEAVSVSAASEEDFTPPAEPGSFGG